MEFDSIFGRAFTAFGYFGTLIVSDDVGMLFDVDSSHWELGWLDKDACVKNGSSPLLWQVLHWQSLESLPGIN